MCRARAATYREGTELCRTVVAAQPEDGEWWNNLAYFLRQRGAQESAEIIDVPGDRDAVAQATFRASWEAYLKAVEYAPDDVRILNPDQLGVFWRYDMIYSGEDVENELTEEYVYGALLHQLADIDYPFTEPPDELEMSENTRAVTKRCISVSDPGRPAGALGTLLGEAPPEDTVALE